MEQTVIARALRAAAEAAIPNDIDLWPSLKARVGPNLSRGSRPALGTLVTRRRVTLALVGAMVALVPGLGLATPLGENTFGKFVQRFGLVLVPSTTLPGPPIGKAISIRAGATPPAGQVQTRLVVNGIPVSPGTVPTPPAKLAPGKAALFFALRLDPIPLDQARKQVHFTVRAPTWLPAGLNLKGALVTLGLLSGGGAVSVVENTGPPASIHVERSSGVIAISGTSDHVGAGTPVAGAVVVHVGNPDEPATGYAVAGTPVAGRAGPDVVITSGSPGRLVTSDVPTSLTIVYAKAGATDARLQVTESEAGKSMGLIVPESAAQSLTVSGHPATYARGKWQPGSVDPPSGMQWDSTSDDGVLSWDDGGVTYVVWSSGLGLSRDDLIRIGESLK
jgi:hypothetical protein